MKRTLKMAKKCPFCGRRKHLEINKTTNDRVAVECRFCLARGPSIGSEEVAAGSDRQGKVLAFLAVDDWNRRKTSHNHATLWTIGLVA